MDYHTKEKNKTNWFFSHTHKSCSSQMLQPKSKCSMTYFSQKITSCTNCGRLIDHNMTRVVPLSYAHFIFRNLNKPPYRHFKQWLRNYNKQQFLRTTLKKKEKKIPKTLQFQTEVTLFKMLFHTLYKYSKDIHTNVRTTLQKSETCREHSNTKSTFNELNARSHK